MLEQIGELLVHCKYGCMPSATEEGKYEVNSAGKKLETKPSDCILQCTSFGILFAFQAVLLK